MLYTDYMKAVNFEPSASGARAFIIYGDDMFWCAGALEKLIALVPAEYADINLKFIDTLRSSDEIETAVSTLSMFPCPTLTVVRDGSYKETEDGVSELVRIASELGEDAYLVLYRMALTPAKYKKAFELIDASRLSPAELGELVTGLFGNTPVSRAAVDKLIKYCASDMQRIALEAEKLSAYSQGERITPAVVEELVADTAENKIFDLTDSLSSNNKSAALRILDRLLEQGVTYPALIGLLTKQYRNMFHARLSTDTDAEVAALLGVKEYAVTCARRAAKRYTQIRLKQILDRLVDAEAGFKSGLYSDETALRTAVANLLED